MAPGGRQQHDVGTAREQPGRCAVRASWNRASPHSLDKLCDSATYAQLAHAAMDVRGAKGLRVYRWGDVE